MTTPIRRLLRYRPPLHWDDLLRFFSTHATAGVEVVEGDSYSRTVALGDAVGWVTVAPGKDALRATLSPSLAPVARAVVERLRITFDLDADPAAIAAHLSADPRLAPLVAARPGLRVPGAFDGFEVLVRTILGQQVSVAGATTLAGRLAMAFGEPVETPIPGLSRAFPTPARLATATVDELAALGIISARGEAIRLVAAEAGNLVLGPTDDPEEAMRRLVALRGIGEWTAHSVAMRAMGWRDAFLHGDLAIRRLLGGKPRELLERAEAWRPWRGYATMHLWRSLSPYE
ncbi:MAG: DNA-3-methyladenine glycosylase 2 family protein [Gemmataceae bacterium]|nr:DNA-3-methyladenine glycosylase 2 family protein [Gemmataceae bacterium]